MKILKFLEELEGFSKLKESILKGDRSYISGFEGSFFAYLISGIFNSTKTPFLILLPQEEFAETFYQDTLAFLPNKDIFFLSSPDMFVDKDNMV